MFIIFGTKGRSVKKGNGRFYCPQCEGERNYTQFKVASYFTLFFIPTFPYKTHGEYVQCESCNQQYNLEVLNETAENILLRKIYNDAAAGMPLQMVSKKLVNQQGLTQLEADAAVQQVANQTVQKNCTACSMSYITDANLSTCTACGGELR